MAAECCCCFVAVGTNAYATFYWCIVFTAIIVSAIIIISSFIFSRKVPARVERWRCGQLLNFSSVRSVRWNIWHTKFDDYQVARCVYNCLCIPSERPLLANEFRVISNKLFFWIDWLAAQALLLPCRHAFGVLCTHSFESHNFSCCSNNSDKILDQTIATTFLRHSTQTGTEKFYSHSAEPATAPCTESHRMVCALCCFGFVFLANGGRAIVCTKPNAKEIYCWIQNLFGCVVRVCVRFMRNSNRHCIPHQNRCRAVHFRSN